MDCLPLQCSFPIWQPFVVFFFDFFCLFSISSVWWLNGSYMCDKFWILDWKWKMLFTLLCCSVSFGWKPSPIYYHTHHLKIQTHLPNVVEINQAHATHMMRKRNRNIQNGNKWFLFHWLKFWIHFSVWTKKINILQWHSWLRPTIETCFFFDLFYSFLFVLFSTSKTLWESKRMF